MDTEKYMYTQACRQVCHGPTYMGIYTQLRYRTQSASRTLEHPQPSITLPATLMTKSSWDHSSSR